MKNSLLVILSLGYCLVGMSQTARHHVPAVKAASHASGIVTDAATSAPLQGVMIASGPFEAITDASGHYAISTTSALAEITFRRDGYTDKVIPLRGDTLRNVMMYSSAFRPSMSSDAFTTATTALSVEDVLSQRAGSSVRAVSRGASAALGSNLFIRGFNSLNISAQPLIIIDGTIWDEQSLVPSLFQGSYLNPLADIDVNDIEDVQILKNASSIYGSKGANGALIITTKRSHSRVTRITVDLSYGFNFRPKTYRMMGANDYRSYLSEIMKGTASHSSLATTFTGMFGTDANAADYMTYHNSNDWADEVYRTGNTQHYGISVDGSDDIAKYAITMGYTSNASTVKSADFSRLNARLNADVSLLRTLSINTSVFFSYLTRNLQDDGVSANTSPTFISAIKSPFLLPYSYTDDGSQLTSTLNDVDNLGVSNPVSLITNAKNSSKHYRFGISLAPTWTINREFTLDGRFSYQFLSTKEHYFSPMNGVSPQVVDGNTWKNTVEDQTLSQNNLYGDVNLKYDKHINYSQINAMVGYRVMYAGLKNSYAEGHNTGNDNVTNLNNSLSYRTLSGVNTDWSSMSLFAKAEYTYDGRYNVWGIVSEDASSRFGKNASGAIRFLGGSWATFPSIGATWNIGKENFMRNFSLLNDAKVYVSYGLTGNDGFDGMNRYAYLSGINYLGSATGLQIGALANNALKWETVRKFNAGIQASLLDDRLTVSFDYFHHVTSDLLTYKSAAKESGVEYYLYNGGKLKNEGFEVDVCARPVVIRNFSWMTDLAISHYKNEITQLPDGSYTTDILGGEVLTMVGQPAGVFYGYKTQGVFVTAKEAEAANLKIQNSDASYSTFAAGDVHFVDVDGNGIINDADKQIIGDPNPDITGSFFNRFTYKNISLDVMCTYSLGNDVYNYQRQNLESMSTLWNQTTASLSRWKSEGQLTSIPRATYGDPMGNSRFSDRWIENGSFFKIKNVKLSYSIPVTNTYIHGLTFWAAVTDVLTLTKYLGVDPEVSMSGNVLYQGIDNGILANGRSVYMGVKINL